MKIPHLDPETAESTFDEVLDRALRGERTNPYPGHKYGIVAHMAGNEDSLAPLTFDTPEEAALFVVQRLGPVLQLVMGPGELNMSIVVLLGEVVN